jgi:similar to spore coat protein
MANLTKLAPHEALELHEIIRSEVTAATKLQASLAMVMDPELKTFMENVLKSKKEILANYQDFYSDTVQQ